MSGELIAAADAEAGAGLGARAVDERARRTRANTTTDEGRGSCPSDHVGDSEAGYANGVNPAVCGERGLVGVVEKKLVAGRVADVEVGHDRELVLAAA